MDDDAIVVMDYFTQVVSIKSDDGGMTRSHQIAGAGARSLAGIADLLIQAVVFAGIAWMALRYRPDLFPRDSWFWAAPVAFAEWHIIYLMLFEGFTGGLTPGKALLGLRVIGVDGRNPTPRRLVVRNVTRVFELALGCYGGAFFWITLSERRQRLGDRYADTFVVFSTPLAGQLYQSEVPESLYSTSEDGYLLQAWIEREKRFDAESQMASAIDLAAYLHQKYDSSNEVLPGPITYLRELHEVENQPHQDEVAPATK